MKQEIMKGAFEKAFMQGVEQNRNEMSTAAMSMAHLSPVHVSRVCLSNAYASNARLSNARGSNANVRMIPGSTAHMSIGGAQPTLQVMSGKKKSGKKAGIRKKTRQRSTTNK